MCPTWVHMTISKQDAYGSSHFSIVHVCVPNHKIPFYLAPAYKKLHMRFVALKSKIDVPNSITYHNWTHMFKWYMVRCDSWNRLKRYTFKTYYTNFIDFSKLEKSTYLGVGGDLYDHLINMITSLFTWLRLWYGFANHLKLIARFRS